MLYLFIFITSCDIWTFLLFPVFLKCESMCNHEERNLISNERHFFMLTVAQSQYSPKCAYSITGASTSFNVCDATGLHLMFHLIAGLINLKKKANVSTIRELNLIK